MTGVQTSQIRAGDVGSFRGLDGIGLRRAATSPMGSAEICAGSIFPLVNGPISENLRLFHAHCCGLCGPVLSSGGRRGPKTLDRVVSHPDGDGRLCGNGEGIDASCVRNELRFGGVAVVGLRRQLGWGVSCCGSSCCGRSNRLGQLSQSLGATHGREMPQIAHSSLRLLAACAACPRSATLVPASPAPMALRTRQTSRGNPFRV